MISTVRPSAAGQIVRIGSAANVHGASCRSQHPPGDCFEAGEHLRIAPLGRSDQRVIEGRAGTLAGTARHAPTAAGTTRLTSAFARSALASSTPTIMSTVTASWPGMPAIVIGDHRHRRVADLGLAGELRLGHVGHPDHVAVPRPVELALGKARELRSFHDHVGAAALQRHAGCRARLRPARRRSGRRPGAPSRRARRSPCRKSSSPAQRSGR